MDKAEYNKLIGTHLKETRKFMKLTQDDIAIRMDITHQVISDYERGKYTPTVLWVEKFCEAIGQSPENFYQEFYKKKREFDDSSPK